MTSRAVHGVIHLPPVFGEQRYRQCLPALEQWNVSITPPSRSGGILNQIIPAFHTAPSLHGRPW